MVLVDYNEPSSQRALKRCKVEQDGVLTRDIRPEEISEAILLACKRFCQLAAFHYRTHKVNIMGEIKSKFLVILSLHEIDRNRYP